MTSIKPLIQEFERILPQVRDELEKALKSSGVYWPDYAYKRYWQQGGRDRVSLQDLPLPVITIQEKVYKTSKQKTCYGWYRPALWSDKTDTIVGLIAGKDKATAEEKRAEINITPEGLEGSRYTVLYNFALQTLKWMVSEMTYTNPNGLNNDQYQTQGFGAYMSQLGWKVEKTTSYGWQANGVRDNARITDVIEAIDFDDEVLRTSRESQVKREFKGSRLKKWSCGCTNLRAATFVEATCLHCGKEFTYEDKDKEEQKDKIDRITRSHVESQYYNCKRHPENDAE